MPEFDLFAQGLRDYKKYIEDMKKDLLTLNDEVVRDACERAESIIRERAGAIFEQEEREAMQTANEITILDRGRFARGRVINTSRHSPYVEYGTGATGEANPYPYGNPYPGQFLGYNVPPPQGKKHLDKNGVYYWFYKGKANYGLPSYAIVYSAAKELERLMPNIVAKAVERRLNR